jgi:pimeloyl-ACP methyl ester carboxylesterase
MCANLAVPLKRAAAGAPANAKMISLFLKGTVTLAADGAARNGTLPPKSTVPDAVILLQGGPGGSSDVLEPLMEAVYRQTRSAAGAVPYDVFVADHRGVGRSSRLGCVAAQAETTGSIDGVAIATGSETPLCSKAREGGDPEYDGVESFSSFEAGADVASMIDELRARFGYERVAVYGVSYGTMWATRFLQQFPDKASAVFLDGVVSTKGSDGSGYGRRLTLDTWDEVVSAVGKAFISGCFNNTACSKNMDAPSWRSIDRFLPDQLEEVCAEMIDIMGPREQIIQTISSGLLVLDARPLITILVHRIKRCSPSDVNAVKRILALFPKAGPPDCAPLSSLILQYNVAHSELFWRTPSVASYADLGWYTGAGRSMSLALVEWAAYDFGDYAQYFNQSFATEIPVAMVNGNLDPQTPIYSAETQRDHSFASPLRFAMIPGANHGTGMGE